MDPYPQTSAITRTTLLPPTQPIYPREVWILLTAEQKQKTFQTLVIICQQIIPPAVEVPHDA